MGMYLRNILLLLFEADRRNILPKRRRISLLLSDIWVKQDYSATGVTSVELDAFGLS